MPFRGRPDTPGPQITSNAAERPLATPNTTHLGKPAAIEPNRRLITSGGANGATEHTVPHEHSHRLGVNKPGPAAKPTDKPDTRRPKGTRAALTQAPAPAAQTHVPLNFQPDPWPQTADRPGPTPHEFAPTKKTFWPVLAPAEWAKHRAYAGIFAATRKTCLPNRLGARITVPSGLNLKNWETELRDYHDPTLTDYLRYGWPTGYTAPIPPANTNTNHPSARDYRSHVDAFIVKELALGGLLGPFKNPPFQPWCHTAPLMTAPKKDTNSRRIILDLSYPDEQSVNAGITKNVLDGIHQPFTLPSIEDLVTKVRLLGPGAYLWKADLARAYRQLRIDPLDTPLLGLKHGDQYYIDICPPFGCRLSGTACQRMSNAVVYLLAKRDVWSLAYLDDYCGAASSLQAARAAYHAFLALAKRLGLELAPSKCMPPTTKLEWLGFDLDTVTMTLTIPTKKLQEILQECTTWMTRKSASKKDIQSLVGRLVHVAKCIKPARRFITRILKTLSYAPESGQTWISNAFKADVRWFLNYAKHSNGTHLLEPTRLEFHIECDSSMEGGGGNSEEHFYHQQYTTSFKKQHPEIIHREAANLLIALRTLRPANPQGLHVVIHTDNMGSQQALESGKAHDIILAACARQLWFEAATNDHTFEIKHKYGHDMPLADALSRQHIPSMQRRAAEETRRLGLTALPPAPSHPHFEAV